MPTHTSLSCPEPTATPPPPPRVKRLDLPFRFIPCCSSAVVRHPAEAVSSLLGAGSEGAPVWVRLSPYGAVFSDGRPEGRVALLSLCSFQGSGAADRRLQAREGAVHAYDLRLLLRLCGHGSTAATTAAVQDGVATRADVPQYVLHRVRGLRLVAFVQPLALAGAQRGFARMRRRRLSCARVPHRHESLKGGKKEKKLEDKD